jgi:hypothetical protein
MRLITPEQLRVHVVADAWQDPELLIKGNAAEEHAERYLNRALFNSEEAFEAAVTEIPTKAAAARTALSNATAAANATEDLEVRKLLQDNANHTYAEAWSALRRIATGMIVNDDIRSAILLHAGHLGANREGVVVGADAVEVPMATTALLRQYRIYEGL